MTGPLVEQLKQAWSGLSPMRRSQYSWSVRVTLRGRCVATERRVVCAAGRRGALGATDASDRQQGVAGHAAAGARGALTRGTRGAGGPQC